MQAAYVIEFTTPKKYIMRGLWFGPKKPKRLIIWLHGLGGTAFSMRGALGAIADKHTAVVTFNNRGHGVVNRISSAKKKKKPLLAGAAHEKFEDCIDDVEGAIRYAKKAGVKNIFLAGHSTGCQKSVYWAYKKGKGVKGVILVAPVSDRAGGIKNHGKKKIEKVLALAKEMIRRGKKNEMLPLSVWSEEPDDAQRFVSLYDADSVEEIFSYSQPNKNPRILKAVRLPVLTVWAANDEYVDKKAREVEEWFIKEMQGRDFHFETIPGVQHGFKGGEKRVASIVRRWITKTRR